MDATVREQYFGHEHVTVIEPIKGWRSLDLKELWAYRELLLVLTMRDIKVRYKQTVLGFTWAIIQPVMMMVVFSIFFGRLGENAVRWPALSDLRVCWPVALDILCQCRLELGELAGRFGPPREQGLLPAPYDTTGLDWERARRFRHRQRRSPGAHALLRRGLEPRTCCSQPLLVAGVIFIALGCRHLALSRSMSPTATSATSSPS